MEEAFPQFEQTQFEVDPLLSGQSPSAPPAEERGQPLDYRIRWSREKIDRLSRRLRDQVTEYDDATKTRGERKSNLEQWRRDYEMMPRDANDGPFDQSSDVTPGLTRKSCDSHHTGLTAQIVQLDPPFAVVARDEEAIQAAPMIEEALTAILEEANWSAAADAVHQELPVAGNVGLRVMWRTVKEPRPFLEGETDEEAEEALIAAGRDPIMAGLQSLKTNARGELKRRLAFRDEVVFDGIEFKVIRWEDLVILPASATCMEEVWGIGERMMISGDALMQGANEGDYIKDAVHDLLQKPPSAWTEEQQEAWDHQGIEPAPQDGHNWTLDEYDYEETALYRSYLCHELCYKLTVKPGMKPLWCWVTIHCESGTVLRLQHLPWMHGRPHYVHFPYLKRTGQLWGEGIAALISGHHDGYGAILNQRIDRGELANNLSGNFFYDDRAGYDPAETDFALGKPIKVENIAGILPIQIPSVDPDQLRVMEILKQDADLITGATDPALGKETSGSHTLGEIKIAMGASQQRKENAAASVARIWAEVADLVRHLAAQYGTGDEVRYRKSAAPGSRIQFDQETGQMQPDLAPEASGMTFEAIPARLLRAKVDLVPAGLQNMADVQSRIQVAQIVFQTIMSLPIAQMNPRVTILALDHYLQVLRVPIRRPLMQEIEQTFLQQAAAQQAEQAKMMGQQAGALDAEAAGQEAALSAALAEQGMAPGEMAGAPPLGIAA